MKASRVTGLVCLVSLACAVALLGQNVPPADTVVPQATVLRLIKFSGMVNDDLGQPRTGVLGITFALYKQQEGGAPLWLETQNVSLDEQGRYTVLLGATQSEGLPLEIFSSGEARWLGMQVQGQPEQPRILLVAVPYALKAAEAETLSGKKASDFILNEQLSEQVQKEIEIQVQERAESSEIPADESGTTPQAVNETGHSFFTDSNDSEVVYVGQSGHGYGLFAHADDKAAIFGHSFAPRQGSVIGLNYNPRGRGVYGEALAPTGRTIGVLGESHSMDGTGVFGSALATTGSTTGVRGDAESPDGVGVFGYARATTGSPVGVRGWTYSPDGIGVEGRASTSSGPALGVMGESFSNRGRGVYGLAQHSTGIVFGVMGASPSTKGRGVYGLAAAATGGTVGVRGDTFSLDGTGVTGFARHETGGVGVYGLALGSSAIAGQFENPGGGKILSGLTSGKSEVFSVDASGNVTATSFTGDLSGEAATFSGSTSDYILHVVQNAPGIPDVDLDNLPPIAVWGEATATNDSTIGVAGFAASPDGVGVVGVNTAQTGSDPAGVIGIATGPTARGVEGENMSPTGATEGVRGEVQSPDGIGVKGYAESATGETVGVWGEANSGDGVGVIGRATAATGVPAGVIGASDSPDGIGVYGRAGRVDQVEGIGWGVWGNSHTHGDSSIGVVGTANAPTGMTYGVAGSVESSTSGATGVYGEATATSGATVGVTATNNSPDGTAGLFVNSAGGKILSGVSGEDELFSVEGNGDLVLLGQGRGIILRSPDGTTCGMISLDNSGTFVTSAVACPATSAPATAAAQRPVQAKPDLQRVLSERLERSAVRKH